MISATIMRTCVLSLLFISGSPAVASPGMGPSGGGPVTIGDIAVRLRAGVASASSPMPDRVKRVHDRIMERVLPGARASAGPTPAPGPTRTRILSGTEAEPAEVVEETWNSGQSQWVNWRRTVYAYTLLGAPLEIITYYWLAAAWVQDVRTRYVYDDNDDLIEEYDDEWDGQAWAAVSLIAYLNDPSGRALSAVYQQWQVSQWENFYRFTFGYDGAGNLIQELWESWVVGAWANYLLLTLTYNVDNNLTTFEYATWTGAAWAGLLRSTLTYDASGWLILILGQLWNGGGWADDNRVTYTNDTGGKPVEELWESWSGTAWGRDLRRTHTYDGGGNVTEELSETWNGSDWQNSQRTLNTWNFSAAPAPAAGSGTLQASAADLLLSIEQNWFDTVWVNYIRTTLSYGPGTDAGSPEELPAGYRLEANYPNPFNPSTTIAFALPRQSHVTIRISDVLGRDVAMPVNGILPPGVHAFAWSPGDLPGGVYFYTIASGEFRESRKMLLLK